MKEEDKEKKKQTFLEAYDAAAGNISVACKKANICRKTFYLWRDADSDFADKVEEIDESFCDLLESKAKQKVMEGDTTMLIFMLKTKCKKRGYVEKTEVDANVNTFEQFMRGLPDNPEDLDK